MRHIVDASRTIGGRSLARPNRGIAAAWLVAAALTIALAGRSTAQSPNQATGVEDFPALDLAAASLVARGVTAKDAARRLVASPDDPATARALERAGRPGDALQVLRRIVERRPDQIAGAFSQLHFAPVVEDSTGRYAAALAEIVELAKARLAGLPREDAARAGRAIFVAEGSLHRGTSAPSWESRLRSFIEAHPGTEPARFAEVDLLSAGPLTPARLTALEDYARAHPGTCEAAKAIYQKGFDLAHNASSLRLPPNPVARFKEVVALSERLRRDGPVGCEWVAKASELVSGFFAFRPVFDSPDEIDVMLAVYRQFVRAEFARDEAGAVGSIAQFVLQTKMGDLFALKGDRVGGIEGVLTELEASARTRSAALAFRAAYHLGQRGENGPDRAAHITKAVETLRAIQRDNVEPYARRAWSTLAALYFSERDYPAAGDEYARYLSRYPDTPWAWVAALRLGAIAVESGKLESAIAAYDRLLALPSLPPPARVLALAYKGDVAVLSALGRMGPALESARAGLAAWDDDFGARYSIQQNQRQEAEDSWLLITDKTGVDKDALLRRVGELELSARWPAGPRLEQGRWLIAHGAFDTAGTVLARAVDEGRNTPLAATARELWHRVRLERALWLADVQRPERDEAAARRELDQIAELTPTDFAVTAARIAKATLLARQGAAEEADAVMTRALNDWQRAQPFDGTATGSDGIADDVAAIRTEVFRPLGGGVYGDTRWNAFSWPAALPRFLVVNPGVTVKLSGGRPLQVTVRRPLAAVPETLFIDSQQLGLLETVMRTLGGTTRRAPERVMDTPNQPVGRALDIRTFWDAYFPTRQGHWFGWVFETYPQITQIEFIDAGRTRAAVAVTVGYSGGTVMLVKENGRWRATELTRLWIT